MWWREEGLTTNAWQRTSTAAVQARSGRATQEAAREHYVIWQTAMLSFFFPPSLKKEQHVWWGGNQDPPHIVAHL